jgi:hypothetical protein
MRKTTFVTLAIVLVPCAFAVDGVVLINQSTVTAGGFPYKITQPGSYKLSGNLTAPLDVGAFLISTSNVVLDLNGFNVSCSTIGGVVCIGEVGSNRNIAIRNGTIKGSLLFAVNNFQLQMVAFPASANVIVEELQIDMSSSVGGLALNLGQYAIVRHTVMTIDNGGGGLALVAQCPGLFVENVVGGAGGAFSHTGSGCVQVNNIGF